MKMVVGLGNPGSRYKGTRHNVGFDVIAELAHRYPVSSPRSKFNGEFAETTIVNQKIVLLCPLTYMNLSGQCVAAAVNFYKLDVGDLLVVCDDFNLPVGRIRIKPSGSAGGQNGLDDIIRRLGTSNFSRLRLGIGPLASHLAPPDFVLGKFDAQDRLAIDQTVIRAADAIESWIVDGIQNAMSRFNSDPDRANQTKKDQSEKKPEPE